MRGTCPCGRVLKCRKVSLGWNLPTHRPEDPVYTDPATGRCRKSGSLRYRRDGTQNMLDGVHTRLAGGMGYAPSHVLGDLDRFATNPETMRVEALPITEGVPCNPDSPADAPVQEAP